MYNVYWVSNTDKKEIYVESNIINVYLTVDRFNYFASKYGGSIYDIEVLDEEKEKSSNLPKCPPELLSLIVSRFFGKTRYGVTWSTSKMVVPQTERFCLNDLREYLNIKINNYGCILFGTRRTGKTVMMQQAMNELIDKKERAIYLSVVKNSIDGAKLSALVSALAEVGFKYIFIDEITYVSDDIEWAVSNIESSGDVKIVIAATDSLALKYLSIGSLYDRCKIIDTTYISYKEYKSIYNSMSIIDYIRNGGLFLADTEWVVTHPIDFSKQYLNTAIIENIVGCFERCGTRDKFPYLSSLSENELRSLFYKWTEHYVSNMVLDMLNRKLTVSDLSIAIRNTVKDKNESVVAFKDRLIGLFKEKCSLIGFRNYNQRTLEEAERVLLSLGCLVKTGDNLNLLIPVAIKYGFTLELVELVEDKANTVSQELGLSIDIKVLKKNIEEHVQGMLIEELIRYDLYRASKYGYKVRLDNKVEIDIVDSSGNFYEVKRSSNVNLQQMRWLVHESVLELNPKSLNLLTLGKSQVIEVTEFEVLSAIKDEAVKNGLDITPEFMKQYEAADKITKHRVDCTNIEDFMCSI